MKNSNFYYTFDNFKVEEKKKGENSFAMMAVKKPTFTYTYAEKQTQKETDS
jgi:hypothetical protein